MGILKKQEKEVNRYPVGTVLWTMKAVKGGLPGEKHDDKLHYFPTPEAIQRVDENSFTTNSRKTGWISIGISYFLTREACLKDWGNKPMSSDIPQVSVIPRKMLIPRELPKLHEPENLNEFVVWRDDDMDILTITVGSGDDMQVIPTADLKWHKNAEIDKIGREFGFTGEYLTLEEISDQIKPRLTESKIIEVRIEEVFKGVIYQWGNYHDNRWRKHGTLEGYA